MRLALITHKVDFNDGQGRVNFEIAQAALDQGHYVTVFGEFCSKKIADHPRGNFVRARKRHIPTQLLRNLYFAWKSAYWLRKHRAAFDIIQVNGFVTWGPAHVVAVHFVHSAWLKNPNYPFLWSSFSPYAYYQRLFTIISSHYEKQAFRQAETLIAVSDFTAKEVETLGIPRHNITVVHNGVDIDAFMPGDSVRESFALPEDVPLALFVGDIRTERKNLGCVIRALKLIDTLHLVVAGAVEGSPYPALAVQLEVSDRVHFLGKTSRIADLMRSATFFVFPSRYEAHPLVLLEALASGLPVIVSGSFGAADYIHEAGRILKDPNDATELASVMNELVSSPDMLVRMSVSARREALNMQWSQTAQGYLNVYSALLDRQSKLDCA